MNTRNRALKVVNFNLDDSYEAELLEYAIAQQKYFSRYVKTLIDRDRNGVAPTKAAPVIVLEPKRVDDDHEDAMNFF